MKGLHHLITNQIPPGRARRAALVTFVGAATLFAADAAQAASQTGQAPTAGTRVAAATGAPSVGRADPPPILPLRDVRPGMTGEGLTVFRGTKPEPFKFRVVSVLRNFLPKQDVILVRVDDERVDKSGIAAGMSGSPCYIDGKLVGAIAYAWSFSKEPLAGVTPIESMLAERTRPRRRKEEAVAFSGSADALAALDGATPRSTVAPVAGPALAEPTTFGMPQLEPVSVPLAVSGLDAEALAQLAPELKAAGLVAMRGAGGSGPLDRAAQGHVEPGSAIGVELIRGDMSAVATGTVTHVEGNTVLAFGHPMLGSGEVELPMVEAEVHTFMPSLATSFKMASPLAEVGTLVQDRQPCIVGDLSRRTKLMPLRVTVSVPDTETRTFRAEIAREKRLSPLLASMVMTSAVTTSEPDPVEMVVTIKSKLVVRGIGEVSFEDVFPSVEGVSPRLLASSRGVRAIGDLLSNPFAPAVIDRMEVDLRVEYRRDWAEILGAALPRDEVEPGETVPVRLTMRSYGGQEFVHTVPVTIPRSLAGEVVKIEIASGAAVRPDVARPESLRGFVETLRTAWTAASIVVSVSTSDAGVSLRGQLLPGLPPGALDTLRPATASARAETYRLSNRSVVPFPRVALGRKELSVRVKEDVLGRL